MKELVAPGQLFQTTVSPTFIVKYGEVMYGYKNGRS